MPTAIPKITFHTSPCQPEKRRTITLYANKCQRCGKPTMRRSSTAKWCYTCFDIRREERNRAAYHRKKAQ